MDVIHRLQQDGDQSQPEYRFHCPACGCSHWFKTTGGTPQWTWNGDFEKPTIRPSILVRGQHVCHMMVSDGKIQYLSDCAHPFAGMTVDMVPDED